MFHSAPTVVQVAIVQVLPLDAAVDVADVVSRKEGEDSVAHLVIGTRSTHSRVSSAQGRELAVHLQLVTRLDHNRVVVPGDTGGTEKLETETRARAFQGDNELRDGCGGCVGDLVPQGFGSGYWSCLAPQRIVIIVLAW